MPTPEKHIDEIYALIDKIETAMLTTRRADGRMVSRPMATQKRALILVDADSVIYMKREKSKPMVLFEVAKGIITGERPDVGDVRKVDLRAKSA